MLFSIPESVWALIAVGAIVFFMVGIPAVFRGIYALEASGPEAERRHWRRFYLTAPPLLLIIPAPELLGGLLGVTPTAEILFLYSAALVALPLTFLPVRGRMLRQAKAHRENPDAQFKLDWLTKVWVCGFLTAVVAASAFVLTMATYNGTA